MPGPPPDGSTEAQSSHIVGRRLRWAPAAVIVALAGLQTGESRTVKAGNRPDPETSTVPAGNEGET
jgi:hypothetical protein